LRVPERAEREHDEKDGEAHKKVPPLYLMPALYGAKLNAS
jgi:hypothetical protein